MDNPGARRRRWLLVQNADAVQEPTGWRRLVRAFRVDPEPLRTSREFRLLLVAGTVFYLGGMVTNVAVAYQLYHLTGSNFAVGALGLVELVPIVVFGLYGGALADHVDRRTMLVGTGAGQVVLTGALLANSLAAHPQVWLIYLLGGLLAVAQSLQRPSRDALIARSVRHDQLTAAAALNALGVQGGMLIGPAIGGLLVGGPGLPWAYGVDVAGLLTATTLYVFLPKRHVPREGSAPGIASIVEGLRYAAGRKDLLGTYLVDITAMVMAMSSALYPAFASHVLNEPQVLGFLYTAETAGGILVALISGWTARVHHHGRAIVVCAASWGVAIGIAGLAQQTWLVLVALAFSGAADELSGIFRAVVWNQTIPDEKRGRLAGIELLSYSLGPLGGQVRAGLIADATSVRTAIVSGGVLCVLGVGTVAALLRSFWSYDARTDEHAVRERELRAAAAGPAGPDT